MWRILLTMATLAVSAWSCAGMQDVVESKQAGDGTTAVYAVPWERAQEIGATVFRWEGAETVEEHPQDGYVLAQVGTRAFSWGTLMGAWFERLDQGKTKVTVVTKRRYQLGLTTDLTEETFHDRFAQAVAIIGQGQELPKSPPD